MRIPESTIKSLHECYQRMSGLDVPLTIQRMFAWEAWGLVGFNEDDLRLVIEVLRRKIKTGPKTIACLRFGNLIGNPETFGEDLAEARALARKPQVDSGRTQVLRATQRPTEPPTAAPRSAHDVLRASEAFKAFQDLKKSL